MELDIWRVEKFFINLQSLGENNNKDLVSYSVITR